MDFVIPIIIGLYIAFFDDIKSYIWSKKSDSEKYAAYRAYMNAWNGTDYD
jgi:hypothetical protein